MGIYPWNLYKFSFIYKQKYDYWKFNKSEEWTNFKAESNLKKYCSQYCSAK